jgi:hypothetical protein
MTRRIQPRDRGRQRAIARRSLAAAAAVVVAASFACRDTATTAAPKPVPTPAPPTLPTSLNGLTELHLPTPDGSFNLLHPSVHCSDKACFMLACQHTLRDMHGSRSSIVENTVGYRSIGTEMMLWTPVANPIMNADEVDSTTDYSDPELLDLRPRLVAYARLAPVNADIIYMKESSDTVHWTRAQDVLTVPRNAGISPTALQNGGEYDLWVVDASPLGCNNTSTITVRRRSRSYADFYDAAVDTTDLNEFSVPGMVPWHIEMIRGPTDRPDSIIALVAMHPVGLQCGNSSLYLGTTVDGKHFTMNPGPVRTGTEDTVFSMIYRSSGVYFPRDRTLVAMLSGTRQNGTPEARLARIRFDYDSLLASTRSGRAPTPLSVQLLPGWFLQSEGRQ